MTHKKVLLAFSGGLDTTYCAKYLSQELDYEVSTVTVNTGGFSQAELLEIEEKSLRLGAIHHETLEVSKEFYEQCVKYLIAGNVLRNNTYPLCVSAERAFQAISIAKYAKKIGADAIAHGSTGAGNDQVRFDLNFQVFCPGVEIITPIRDQTLSREAEISYLTNLGVESDWKQYAYSINKGLWGTSVGGVETLTSHQYLPESAFPSQLERTDSQVLVLGFERGEIKAVDDKEFKHPIEAIQHIDEVASKFAIGRDIHVGDTIIGIKGRVGFEAAAPSVILKAHHCLEKHVLTKSQMNVKDQLSNTYGAMVHEAMFSDPVLRDIEAFLENSQQRVTGDVSVALHPYRFHVEGIKSDYDLMSDKFGVYGEMNKAWSGEDVKGFTKILSNQTSIYFKAGENV